MMPRTIHTAVRAVPRRRSSRWGWKAFMRAPRRGALSRLGANRVNEKRQQQKIGRDPVAAQVAAHGELQQHEQRDDDRIAVAVGASHCGGFSGISALSWGTVNAFRRSEPTARCVVKIITCESSAG